MVDTASPTCMPLAHPAVPWPSKAPGARPGERTRRILYGELDIDSVTRLQPDLFHDLLHSAAGLDLDLRPVTFSDCSGVNLLLRLRRHATRQGKTLVISAMSPAMERILDITRTRTLLCPEPRAQCGLSRLDLAQGEFSAERGGSRVDLIGRDTSSGDQFPGG